jgi:hypothetical protein
MERRSFLSGIVTSVAAGAITIASKGEVEAFGRGSEVITQHKPQVHPFVNIGDPEVYLRGKDGFVSVGDIRSINYDITEDAIVTLTLEAFVANKEAMTSLLTNLADEHDMRAFKKGTQMTILPKY